MPHIDGLAVLNRLSDRELDHFPNVIMLTAFGQEKVMKEAVDLGAAYFILKPFNLDNLADQIRQIHDPGVSMIQLNGKNETKKKKVKQDLEGDITNIIHEIGVPAHIDRKSTRLNSSHVAISYAVFCLKKKK